MIYSKSPVEQVDIDLAEDGVTVVAWGHTADPDDTAFATMRMPLDPFAYGEDLAEAFDAASGFLKAFVKEFGQAPKFEAR